MPVRPLQADPVSTAGNQPDSTAANASLSVLLMLHVVPSQLQPYPDAVVVLHMY